MKSRMSVDNTIYRREGNTWWDEESSNASLRFLMNPVRFGYFRHIIESEQAAGRVLKTVLDVGCGGGLLAEEFAKSGFAVTGIDPVTESLECARRHAAKGWLKIDYQAGQGESLPFDESSFDIVTCCDVIEHVDDVECVLSEMARVLKMGGLLFYDTVNRTLFSKLVVIKVSQEWPSTAFNEPNTHAWDRFITPEELTAMMSRVGLTNREIRGISSEAGLVSGWINLYRRAKGRIGYRELAERLRLRESDDTRISYMGHAVKGSRGEGSMT